MLNYFPHFSISGYSNSYIIGNQVTGEAIIVDPGHFDIKLLNLIEKNNLDVKHVLITHSHDAHVQGLKTLLKIYDAKVYAGKYEILGIETIALKDCDILPILNSEVRVQALPGHSRDSLVFFIENMIFSGDVLEAGNIGSTSNDFLKAQLLDNLKSKIFNLEENYFVCPGHGPITTLQIEKLFNLEI